MEKRIVAVIIIAFALSIIVSAYPACLAYMAKPEKPPDIMLSELDKNKKYDILGRDVDGNLIIRERKEP